MKALVYTKTNKVEYLDYKDPEFKKDESIVKVSASGICGSDMHAYHGKDTRRVPPLILGHEISGTIEQGKNKGAKVIINPLISCGNCKRCNTGSEHLCPDRSLIGMNKPHIREGGLAEFVSVPDKNIYNLPSNLEIKILMSLLLELRIEANSSFCVLAKLKHSTIKSLMSGLSGFFV